MVRRHWLTIAALALIATQIACEKSEFHGAPKLAVVRPVSKDLEIPCEAGKDETVKNIQVEANEKGANIRLRGTLCKVPETQKQVVGPQITFIIDYSGSMSLIDPIPGIESRGDAQIRPTDTCKRFEAAKALFTSLESRLGAQIDQVSFSVFKFDENAAAIGQKGLTGSQFKQSHLNPQVFCNFSDGAYTNYDRAFQVAREELEVLPVEQEKHVFLLTDGTPTMMGTPVPGDVYAGRCDPDDRTAQGPCRDAGRNAAQALRSQVNNLTLNVLFLVNPTDQQASDEDRTYLETQVAASPANVKYARDAQDASTMIRDFKPPEVKEYTGVAATAELTGGGVKDTVGVRVSPSGSNQWGYQTDVIRLPGREGSYTLVVVPTARGERFGVLAQVKIDVVYKPVSTR